MSTMSNTLEQQLEADNGLCKKLLHELLKNQSVASWAVSTLELDTPAQKPLKGVPIIGRNGQDSVSEQPPISPAPQLDQVTVASVVRALAADRHRVQSDSGSDTSSELSGPAYNYDRSMSLPVDGIIGINGMNSDRYKTELCRQYQETGFCKYGAKCQFAHGRNELRNVNRHPRYKTEMCRTYHTRGLCPYGTRCHFIHDEEELQTKPAKPLGRSVQRHSSLPIGTQRRNCHSFNPAVGSLPEGNCLGSVGDTPPSSLHSSPAPSPTSFLGEDRVQSLPLPPSEPCSPFVQPPPGFAPATAPAVMSSVFDFKDLPTPSSFSSAIPSPVNFGSAAMDPVHSLAAGLQAAVPGYNPGCMSDFYMPYTAQSAQADSDTEICESPMDISRNLRLPIFSQLSKE